jgi:hypothetical protein
VKALRVLAVPFVVVLVAASCGGGDDGTDGADDDGADDVEAFCERLRALEADDTVDVDEDFDAAMAEMTELRDAAPAELRDDLDMVIDVFRQMDEIENAGGDDEDTFGAVFALLLDPEFTAASERLEQWGVDECGLEPSTDDGFDDMNDDTTGDDTTGNDTTGDGASDDAVQPGGLITEAADVPDPLYDPIFDDDVVDPSSISINGLQYHLDVNHTDAPWRTRLTSFSIGGSVGVGGLELDDVAVDVCNAVAEYIAPFEPGWEITIESYAQDDTGAYNYVGDLITGTAGDGC